MAKHALVFIHGMGSDAPQDDYDILWALLRDAYDAHRGTSGAFEEHFAPVRIVWKPVTLQAEGVLHKLAFDTPPQSLDPSAALHPIQALRTFTTFFVGDVVAYVSEDDNGIRRRVYEQLQDGVKNASGFSIIAHSLGSVIAHDFLFHLFCNSKIFDPIKTTDPEVVEPLKSAFHGLYTMGAPIGLFMLQKGLLWKQPPEFSQILYPLPDGQVWRNFWDKQDVIAYPLGRLFGANPKNDLKAFLDVAVDTGSLVVDSHLGYWRNRDVADAIAATLP